ncbi:MAG TPA: acyltransferase [Actinomycetota bacterium]|jgi:fucose 4-O-acetylase-like acetyltransferase|nr:acyltransferase [Actinomycetota bacterium]
MGTSLDRLAEQTPATRDRYVDFLRAASIVAVVIGHWLISLNRREAGITSTVSAIGETSWLWLATWFLQVIPIFFFVGGFANLTAYESLRRRGGSTGRFLRTRMARLLKPTLVFVGVWGAIEVVLHLADCCGTGLFRGVKAPPATVPFGPLWFLGVYLLIVLLSPLTIRLHRRFGIAVPIALLLAAVVGDAIGFIGGVAAARIPNVLSVWLLAHQLGYFYADGGLTRLSKAQLWAMALAALAVLVLLTNPPIWGDRGPEYFSGLPHYPKSLLGTDNEPISNMNPPTLALAAMTFWSIGLAMLARPAVSRWLARPGPWKAVVLGNTVVMTLFLWHMTAYLLAVIALWALGLGRETDSTARWWLERPIWIATSAVFLLGLVAIFGRFERPAKIEQSTAPAV